MKLNVVFENHKVDKENYVIKASVGIWCGKYGIDYYSGIPFKVIGKGIAKCNPTDKFDEKYGRNLAISRAYADAYQQIFNKLKRDINRIDNHYGQLLCKLHDCITSEENSISRLAAGVDIYRSVDKKNKKSKKLLECFNKINKRK